MNQRSPSASTAEFFNTIGAKRTFASTQHFVTDKELAKSYPVLHWANENALFDTLAGIEQLRNILIYRIHFSSLFDLLANLLTHLLLLSYELCGAMRCCSFSPRYWGRNGRRTLAKAVEPFFSTTGVGEGHGSPALLYRAVLRVFEC
jgi:hypothetical protein